MNLLTIQDLYGSCEYNGQCDYWCLNRSVVSDLLPKFLPLLDQKYLHHLPDSGIIGTYLGCQLHIVRSNTMIRFRVGSKITE
uniref:Uncharacterized protein n=1 Tax=viral metagenome TaxID=1070528 RepID=A0A6C0CJB5_9ZZZZ